MKFYLILALVLMFTSGAMAAGDIGLSFEVEALVGQEVKKGTVKYFIHGDQLRKELKVSGEPQKDRVFIEQRGTGKQFVLYPAKKTYKEADGTSGSGSEAAAGGKTKFAATAGKTGKIAGYSCRPVKRHYEGQEQTACLNKDLLSAAELATLHQLDSSLRPPLLPELFNDLSLEYLSRQLKGKAAGKVIYLIRLLELRREPMAASMFEVPKDYGLETVYKLGKDDLKKIGQYSQPKQVYSLEKQQRLNEIHTYMRETAGY